MLIGTAGHIDHGKTTLVKALTGVDADRLPEEKARGITREGHGCEIRSPGACCAIGARSTPGWSTSQDPRVKADEAAQPVAMRSACRPCTRLRRSSAERLAPSQMHHARFTPRTYRAWMIPNNGGGGVM